MNEWNGIYINPCYRNGPCLFGEQVKVSRGDKWDYFDKVTKSYVYLECRLHQKYWTPSLLQIEEAEKYASGMGSASYETPDLQLADSNGRWMTRSDDPDCYYQQPYEEPRTCSICDIVCDIRDDKRYLLEDGICPFDDPAPDLRYWKIEDEDQSCQDFLHPLLLQNVEAINRKRRRAAKAHIWKSLREPRWMHALIHSGERMIDVWRRNYRPVTFFYRSFETVVLYLKSLPAERKTPVFLKHLRRNLGMSPSFRQLIHKNEYERRMLAKIDKQINGPPKTEKEDRMVRIHTVQIAVARQLGLMEDPGYLDTTVKSGDSVFAPTWKMVMASQQGKMSEEEYTHAYYEKMRRSYKENRSRWDEVLGMEEVFLACYCQADSFCHRYLLKDMLVKCGAEYVGEIRDEEGGRNRSIRPAEL